MPRTYPTTPMCDGELLARFEPTARDSDVFISTSAKCGQTWLQTLIHHLKTRGRAPDFGGIGLGGVSPWLELPGDKGFGASWSSIDERIAQLEAVPDPRVFKMHVVWDEVPRPAGSKAKVITISRDPRDVPYSMFAHMHGMKIKVGDGPPAEFDAYFERWMEFGFYFKFASSFWPHRDDADVLWLRYEDLQRDLRGQTDRIVAFLGWDVTPDDIERVLPLVDFQRMRSREKTEIFTSAAKTWKEDGFFFREGGVGKNRARLNPDQERRILERMRAELPEACEFLLGLG